MTKTIHLDLHGTRTETNLATAVHLLNGVGIKREECQMGGGTALAIRWKHRISTDIDLFVSAEVFQKAIKILSKEKPLGMPVPHPMITRLLGETSGSEIIEALAGRHGIEWKTKDKTEGSIIPRFYHPHPQGIPIERESSFGIMLERPRTILHSKAYDRLIYNQEYMDRDLYDMIAATTKAPQEIIAALASPQIPLRDREKIREAGHKILRLLQSNPEWKGTEGDRNRPVIMPHRPNLMGRALWEEGVKLLLEGPEKYIARLRQKQSRGSSWER